MKSTHLLPFAVLVFMILGCIDGNSRRNQSTQTSDNPTTNDKYNSSKIEETPEFLRMNAEEHLTEAKRLFNNGNPTENDFKAISAHLKMIPENSAKYKEVEEFLKQISKKYPEADPKALEVVSSSWRKGAFGTAGIWSITFYNKTNKAIGDIKYQTKYYSETRNDLGGTGGVLGDGEIQKIIPPKQKRTITINDGFIHKEAAAGRFEITGWRFIQQ